MQNDFFLTTWFLEAMKWVYLNIGDVFLTILICTVVLRMLTFFSDVKMKKSGIAMASIQPEIDKIQKKYKDDPRKAQAEQSKLMKARGVSMWGSCLPALITMPLFFCFVAAFRFWGYEMTLRLLTDENAMELFRSFKFLWVLNIWQPDNGLAPVVMNAEQFFTTPDIQKLLFLQDHPEVWDRLIDMGLAVKTLILENGQWVSHFEFLKSEAAIQSYTAAVQPFINLHAGYTNGWFVLPVIAGATNLVSAMITQRNQPKTQAASAGTGKLMMYIFPVMSFVFCLQYNAAFAIYWTISSMLMIVSNLILNKKYPNPNAPIKEDKKK